ncbi:helix-turn-helix transcriptional regulator [Kitasatospora sp. NPDC056531]|uniref:helix-turn-helix transcriptional regulator n=1 Tax=Kitasatospora sp. NPDC056531 TaxID=3345856 RepID=UPI003675021D
MTIREHYSEPLSLDSLARPSMVSKFHFLRSFRRITGVTPGRFLTAVRLQEAKRLLRTTSYNVADISAQVGYGSTGSFTRRFTESVGYSPTEFRRIARSGDTGPGRISCRTEASPATGEISGIARTADRTVSAIFIGVFDSPILERQPVTSTVITGPGAFRLTDVPAGPWYLHAVTYDAHAQAAPAPSERPLLVDMVGPVEVTPGARLTVELTARPSNWTRPPILLSLPDLADLAVTA